MQTQDGFRTRTPWQTSTDVHVDDGFTFGGERRLQLEADFGEIVVAGRVRFEF